MKFLAIILAVLVIQIVDAVEEEGDVNIIIKQNVVLPDVDECLEKIDSCADNELCINMPGTYRCACLDGFEKVKGICKDVDECSENIDTCHDTKEVCVNRAGSFSCVCSDGFEKLKDICEDIDECLENCGVNGECVNSPGSFTCTCNEGFEEVEGICEDIDECKDNSNNPCGDNAICTNTIGNYTCTCNHGYSNVGGICTECSSPSIYHDELGCITGVGEKKTWADANSYCQNEGKRLIEEIKDEQMDFFYNQYGTNTDSYNWIGMQHSRWITSNEEVPIDDDIWIYKEPSLNNDICGALLLDTETGLTDEPCSDEHYFLCQSLP